MLGEKTYQIMLCCQLARNYIGSILGQYYSPGPEVIGSGESGPDTMCTPGPRTNKFRKLYEHIGECFLVTIMCKIHIDSLVRWGSLAQNLKPLLE